MTLSLTIPPEWSELLDYIQAFAPSAILAGGALRDLDNDRPVKDLDVFVHRSEAQQALDCLREAGFSIRLTYRGGYITGKDVLFAYSCSKEGHIEVNLIVLKLDFGMNECLSRMDFGICQAGTDGESIVTTDAYDSDKENKSITLKRAESKYDFDWSMKRYRRLQTKYDWPLVIPEEFQQWLWNDGRQRVR